MKKRKKLPAQQLNLFNKETTMNTTAVIYSLLLAALIALGVGYFYATTHGVIIF